jgi:translation initiation factor IF-3
LAGTTDQADKAYGTNETMARWEVTLIGKKGHRYGVIEARDEREANEKAADEFQIPPELRFKIAVTKLADKK